MEKISLTMGNQATFIIKLKRGNESFPVEDSTDVRVRLIHNEDAMVCTPSINVGEVMINVPAMRCVGSFGIEVTGVYNGARWRTYGADVIEYTYDTRVGDSSVTVAGDDFEVSMEVQLYVSEVTPSSIATQEWVIEQGYAKSAELATVATTGDYNDLDNTPVIPAAQVNADWNATSGVAEILNKPTIPAEQVNADWNATTGKAKILNKPTIPTALADLTQDATHRTVTDTEKSTWNDKSNFSGSYNDLTDKPTIPAAQVNSDWDAASGVAQILNKPTIPTALADLTQDATHRVVTDTEKATWNAKQNALTFDSVPTDASNNPVKSGGVYDATVTKQEKMIMMSSSQGSTFNAAPNYYHLFTNAVNTLTITLPTISSVLYVQDIVFGLTTGESPALTFTSSHNIYYADGYAIEANTRYEVNALFNGIDWVIMATKIATS